MPHLVKMDRRYHKKGLRIIGAEVQGSSDEDIESVAKDQRIKFPVTRGVRGPNLTNGIPHAAVFDVAGKLVFSGHPMDDAFEDAVRDALKSVSDEGDSDKTSGLPNPLVPEREWTNREGKSMTATLLSVKDGTGTFRRSDGKTFPYAIDQLSQADQEMIGNATE